MRGIPEHPNLRIGITRDYFKQAKQQSPIAIVRFSIHRGHHLNPFVINGFKKSKMMTTLSSPGNEK
jgi:hypothetical protein